MVELIFRNNTCETIGLLEKYGYELKAGVADMALKAECEEFVQFLVSYISGGASIRPNETVLYGYWLTKAMMNDQKRMVFFEYNQEATEFIFGVTETLTYWKEQHRICRNAYAPFTPPRADQMIVISEGVYEGDAVEGVRYPSPEHMSGWWFTTDRYDGNIDSLKSVHAHHVTAKRPDLSKFIALPNGYRFFASNEQEETWFDNGVAEQQAQ